MQLQFSRKFLTIPALLIGVQFFSGCSSTMAVRPSYGEQSPVCVVKTSSQPSPTTKSEKKKNSFFVSRGYSTELSEDESGGRNVEGDPESYAMSEAGAPIISVATKYLGARYRSGATGPHAFDCSGYVWKVYSTSGINITRASSGDYFEKGNKIDREEALPGDMIFFREHGRINHVGIYMGDDKFIHSSTGLGVIESSMNDNYWKPRLAGFRRFGS